MRPKLLRLDGWRLLIRYGTLLDWLCEIDALLWPDALRQWVCGKLQGHIYFASGCAWCGKPVPKERNG